MNDAIQVRSGAISQPAFISYLDGPLVLVSPPVGLPVDLTVAQAQCRIDADIQSLDASWLSDEIRRAMDRLERDAGGKQLLAARWQLPVKTWWGGWSGGVPGIYGLLGLSYGLQCSDGTLHLPRAPLQKVVAVQYYDTTDTLQTLAASNYIVRTPFNQPGEIDRAPLAVWPPLSPYRQFPILIDFVAGYAQMIGSVSTTADTITVPGPRTYSAGETVRFSNSGGSLPGGLTYGQTYYVVNPSNGGLTFQVALTLGGSAVDLTSAGTCTHYVGEIPLDAQKAILLMAAYGYRSREPGDQDKYLDAAVAAFGGRQWTGGYA